jgi:hypothetical protein
VLDAGSAFTRKNPPAEISRSFGSVARISRLNMASALLFPIAHQHKGRPDAGMRETPASLQERGCCDHNGIGACGLVRAVFPELRQHAAHRMDSSAMPKRVAKTRPVSERSTLSTDGS